MKSGNSLIEVRNGLSFIADQVVKPFSCIRVDEAVADPLRGLDTEIIHLM